MVGATSLFFFSSRRRHTRCSRDWSSDVCSSDLLAEGRAHAPCMAQHEVPLELGALGRRDDDVLELADAGRDAVDRRRADRKSTRLNSSHGYISYAVFCLKKKKKKTTIIMSHSVV